MGSLLQRAARRANRLALRTDEHATSGRIIARRAKLHIERLAAAAGVPKSNIAVEPGVRVATQEPPGPAGGAALAFDPGTRVDTAVVKLTGETLQLLRPGTSPPFGRRAPQRSPGIASKQPTATTTVRSGVFASEAPADAIVPTRSHPQAEPTVSALALHPPHSFAATSPTQTRRSPSQPYVPHPNAPQGSPGSPSRTSHPPQPFTPGASQ